MDFEHVNLANGCCIRRNVFDAVDGGMGMLVALMSMDTAVMPERLVNNSLDAL